MADFCRQCSLELFGEDYGDFAGIASTGEVALVLCEDCGLTHVDQWGRCVSDCDKYHKRGLSATDDRQLQFDFNQD
jgi:hypothetical protein